MSRIQHFVKKKKQKNNVVGKLQKTLGNNRK